MATKTEIRTKEKQEEREQRRERGRRIQRLRVERDIELGELANTFKRKSAEIYNKYQEKIDEARRSR